MDRDQQQNPSSRHDLDQRDSEWEWQQALLRMEDDGCPNFPDHD